MAKRIFLVHGWEGRPERGWKPWLKKELESKGFEVIVPAMPDTDNPNFEKWLEHLQKNVGNADKDCYFVGHSLGCITILRFIEALNEKSKIGGAILVAGFTSNLGYEELDSFFQKPIEWNKIKSKCNKFVAIFSNNDPYVSLHYGDFFKKELNAEVIVEHDKKHFGESDGVLELPIVLEKLTEMT